MLNDVALGESVTLFTDSELYWSMDAPNAGEFDYNQHKLFVVTRVEPDSDDYGKALEDAKALLEDSGLYRVDKYV